MENNEKRLYKSESNKVIGGVCGGLGEYLDIDPTILRIVAVVLIFLHGAGLVIYLVAWLCMPKRKQSAYKYPHYNQNGYQNPHYDQNGSQNPHYNQNGYQNPQA